MRAAVIRDGALVVEERPDPVAAEGEVLIRVQAAGINNADLIQRAVTTRRRPARRPTSQGSSAQARWWGPASG